MIVYDKLPINVFSKSKQRIFDRVNKKSRIYIFVITVKICLFHTEFEKKTHKCLYASILYKQLIVKLIKIGENGLLNDTLF
jgi:hypothetical protein